MQHPFNQASASRAPRIGATVTLLAASLLLAACSSMPSGAGHSHDDMAQTSSASMPASAESSGKHMAEQGYEATLTQSLNCVPTREAQALGLTRTERVTAAYQTLTQHEAGAAQVRLSIGGKTFTLREAPAASGSRYVGGDSLVPGHKGFSWHTKRDEAILSSVVAGGGVDSVVDGPLLYRCMAVGN